MSDRYDVIVFGATGYTGQRVCEYLQKRKHTAPFRWAVAGRRKATLETLQGRFGADGHILADATNQAQCDAMAKAGKVVINLAGPYLRRGEPVAAACAKAGTHYLDLTGELLFQKRLIEAWDATAKETGARIVPTAGYEALPFDLLTHALIEDFTAAHGHAPTRIDVLSKSQFPKGARMGLSEMVSGGTSETFRVAIEDDHTSLSTDPAALNPEDDPDRATVAAVNAYQMKPQDGDLEEASLPIIPIPYCNPAIVHRGLALVRMEGSNAVRPDLAYRERMSTHGMGPMPVRRAMARGAAAAMTGLGKLITQASDKSRKRAKAVIDKIAPHPGDGPPLERLDLWRWQLIGRATDGAGNETRRTLNAEGHPGYRSTANMIAEAALILAAGENLPQRAGLLTPATALGTGHFDRFAAAGLDFNG